MLFYKGFLVDYTITMQDNGCYLFEYDRVFCCNGGTQIPHFHLSFERHGNSHLPLIVIIHAHSTSFHVATHSLNPEKGWWESVVGPGKAIDTNHYQVLCIGNLGSYIGCTNPTSTNPATQQPYRTTFPDISINDIARAQQLVLEALGIQEIHAIIGNSMGGFVAQTLACHLGNMVKKLILVATAHSTPPYTQALHSLQRASIESDPAFNAGLYVHSNFTGMQHARTLGLLSYFNPDYLNTRFQDATDLTSYLAYNVHKFCTHYDPNTYLSISKTMDTFDLSAYFGSYQKAYQRISASTLIISIASDSLFPACEQVTLARHMQNAGCSVSHITVSSNKGHDAFYSDTEIKTSIADYIHT